MPSYAPLVIGLWKASIAHADMADWVTVAAYLLAAVLAARAAVHARLRHKRRDRSFWRITTVLLVFLAINELLDLQTLMALAGREHAKANGWYQYHRQVQFIFLIGLMVAAALAGLAMLYLTRRTHAAMRLALGGLVFIGLFVLVRAVSFHNTDANLGRGWAPFNWGSMQEMGGILVVAAAAVFYIRKRQARSSHRHHRGDYASRSGRQRAALIARRESVLPPSQ